MFVFVLNGLRMAMCGGRGLVACAIVLCAVVVGSGQAQAQSCEATWLPGEPGASISGSVLAMINFDPDGAGPRPSLLIAGGTALVIPGYEPQKLIAFDGQYWRPLETGAATGSIIALTVFNNQLVVAGDFSTVGGIAASDVASWNGTTWSALSSGLGTGTANAVVVHSGQLYMGGSYSTGTTESGIARWNGSTWTTVGAGMTGGSRQVNALLSFNGVLYAGGNFTTAGCCAATNLAVWDGLSWSAVGNPDGTVYALGSFTGISIGSARLFVGGAFTNIGGIASNYVASLRFDPINGNTWNAHTVTGMQLASSCRALQIRSVGVTTFQINALIREPGFPGGGASQEVYRLSGATWNALNAPGFVTGLGTYAGQMTVGTTQTLAHVYAFDNTAWRPLTKGTPGRIVSLAAGENETYAATLTPTSFLAYWRVYKRDNATGVWSQLGGDADSNLYAVLVRANGRLVVAGQFSQIGVQASKIAEWNGTAWQPLGPGIGTGAQFSVAALAETAGGDLIAGGFFNTAGGQTAFAIARWNGTVWSPIGSGIIGSVRALAIASNGDIIAGGTFPSASGTAAANIARWNGVNWLPFGSGLPTGVVNALAILPDGSVVAGGTFSINGAAPTSGVARWNGTVWEMLGGPALSGGLDGDVVSLRVLPSGDLIAGGLFDVVGGVSANNIARWDGTAWHAMEEGVSDVGATLAPAVKALTVDAAGALVAGGDFSLAGADVSAYFARWGVAGAGCCDSIDFNGNGVFPEDQDVVDFLSVLAGETCASCNDIDFNNNGVFPEDQDVVDFLTVLAGGTCG